MQWRRKRQVEFFENLCHLSKVGFDLENSLQMLQVLLNLPVKDMANIMADLTAGKTFAAVMTPYVRSEIVQQLDFAIIHGRLTLLLQELGARERIRLAQFSKLRQILLYPMVLMILLFILIVGYLTVLLPEFRQAGMNLSTLNLRLNTCWIITGCALPIISCSLSFWWFTKQQWAIRMRLLMRCPIYFRPAIKA